MTARERMVGSISCGFSVSKIERGVLGRLFQDLEQMLAASFMNAEEVKMVNVRLASAGGR